ncbi:hypothetical protein [Streptomyces sp. NPDC086787]|uniref:hypothetical protein n=1 Tax=Streptomyces sp. NPDC086787 TaxID=3365759 RepID=UPI003811788A
MDQMPYAEEHASAGGGAGRGYYSDVLGDFLDSIRKLESEYMSVMRERYGSAGGVPNTPVSHALDGTS